MTTQPSLLIQKLQRTQATEMSRPSLGRAQAAESLEAGRASYLG